MKIAIGSDHTAVDLKKEIIEFLNTKNNIEVIDLGPSSKERTDYPLYAHDVCTLIQQKQVDYGILICGTGVGMSIAANKHLGIRAVVCSDTFSAKASKQHNDSNVLCFGARVVGSELAKDIVDSFLNAEYEGGRHQKRVDMLDDYLIIK
ncbi:MAG: ribose 5-phosphate isomerase B [Tenericutes bacterium HGW-Tenericutes-5]|jgi:ribose 5-phosphate isomerase B|nr:MAG: ribose 5-phosphate isomerase B [Tenericutes bacterium HGW-Tenericutes-5]